MRTRKLLPFLVFYAVLGFVWNTSNSASGAILSSMEEITIRVRRDTSYGVPWESSHNAGISTILWGSALSGTSISVSLARNGSTIASRTTVANRDNSYSISMDHFIDDGDIITFSGGGFEKTIHVPVMSYQVDTRIRVIKGVAPANIISTQPDSPHSLQISIGGSTHQVTTSSSGEFLADFSEHPYLASLLGSMHYVNPEGIHFYKPVFAIEPLVRGKLGDSWADVILGKPDFNEIVFNEVAGNYLFNPQGVHVDRSVQPNRVYVYDAGNSRVLGLSHLGYCNGGENANGDCTTDSDCPASSCQAEQTRIADLVLGQPSLHTSACNEDSSFQRYPEVSLASEATLCGLREEQMSVSEGGSGATMATDANGNLYVTDFFNNRVLRYNSPFATDALADYVWGQADFSGIFCNRGSSFGYPTSRSLCLAPPPGWGDLRSGVAIDPSGNLWVADSQNNRVLRFPNPGNGIPAQEADLVLGQVDFLSAIPGNGLHQMNNPASLQVTVDARVYVADSLNNRVLVFEPPFSNGMSASRVLPGEIERPTGLGLGSDDDLWVNDNGHDRFVHYVNEVPQEVISGVYEEAGLGVDRDGNVYSAGWPLQVVLRHSAPSFATGVPVIGSNQDGLFNQTTSRSLNGGHGLEIAGTQLIHGDNSRLLFWNDIWSLRNYQPADGFIGVPDFETRYRWNQRFQRMRADNLGTLWVIYKDIAGVNSILGYRLPLTTGEEPMTVIHSPLPVLGGGEFSWSTDFFLGGIDIDRHCDCLWLSDEGTNRVFRIRNVHKSPAVDVILGQVNASGTECNQGRGRDYPTANSLCHPGALTFDKDGNLFVADHNLEFDGNLRLLEWDASVLPALTNFTVFGIPATRVFGRNGSFTDPNCQPFWKDPMCGPWEPAFDVFGRMLIGFNGYLGSRFPMIYQDPLDNPMPVAALGDFHSMPLSARFDQLGNLYIVDHNRSRILIYRNHYPNLSFLTIISKRE